MSYIFTAVSLLNSSTNYSVINMPCLYNLFIYVLKELKNEDERDKFLEECRLQMGITFYDNFRAYVLKKYPYGHELARLVNKENNNLMQH